MGKMLNNGEIKMAKFDFNEWLVKTSKDNNAMAYYTINPTHEFGVIALFDGTTHGRLYCKTTDTIFGDVNHQLTVASNWHYSGMSKDEYNTFTLQVFQKALFKENKTTVYEMELPPLSIDDVYDMTKRTKSKLIAKIAAR
jgi:hypothetical protein